MKLWCGKALEFEAFWSTFKNLPTHHLLALLDICPEVDY